VDLKKRKQNFLLKVPLTVVKIVMLVRVVLVLVVCVSLGLCETRWFPCPLFTDSPISLNSNGTTADKLVADDTLRSECAWVPMPLDYNDSTNPSTVRLFIKRLFHKDVPAGTNNQLWFFSGGAGGDSSGIEQEMYRMYSQIGDKFDLYTSDHRGTGRSERLSCDDTQAETIGSDGGIVITLNEYVECVKLQPEHWKKFTITNAATDQKNLMEMFSTPNQKVFVYGK
jgi:hypothetical protein